MPVPVDPTRHLILAAACFVAACASFFAVPLLAFSMGWVSFDTEPAIFERLHWLGIALFIVLTFTGVVLLYCRLRRAP